MTDTAFLVGQQINLRSLTERDLEGPYLSWLNDPEVCAGNAHHIFPYTMEEARDYLLEAHRRQDRLILAIVRSDSNAHIGNAALDHIHSVNRSAEFAILIGDKTSWRKGYGLEAARLICDHGFLVLNLHRIACGTFEHNVAMRKLAARLGMVEEGRRREAVYKSGRYVDVIEYGVLRREYLAQFHLAIVENERQASTSR